MDASELFRSNLGLIDRVARAVCARRRFRADEMEDFVSSARLALLDHDYAILRRYEGRSSMAGFLAVVFDHLISDQRDHAFGRWHASRAAERMGPAGVLLETLIRRDQRSLDDALPVVRGLEPSLTREAAQAMIDQFPERVPRPRAVAVDDLTGIAVEAPERSDARTLARESRSLAVRTEEVVRRTIDTFVLEDRMLIRMHFGWKLSIADVSRMLRVPQRPLYRRLDARLAQLRAAIDEAGLDAQSIAGLIGAAIVEMDFGLDTAGNPERPPGRPSIEQEAASAGDEWS